MDGCFARLQFTRDYIGVIRATNCPDPEQYRKLEHHPSVQFLYFQNREKNALWLGIAGEHIDYLSEWFRSAHRALTCSSTVAAVIKNDLQVPRGEVDALFIGHAVVTPEVFDGFIRTYYAIYLADADEFLVMRPVARRDHDPGVPAAALLRGLTLCGNVDKVETPPGEERKRKPYDPIFKQIDEVIGPIGFSAKQAASDLADAWTGILKEAPPADIRDFVGEIEHTIDRIRRSKSYHPDDDTLSVIDGLAMSLRGKRRAAYELLSGIRDFEWPPSSPPMTYERAATRLMLRAVRRYAQDVAKRLDLDEYDFLPVVGQDFDHHPGLFSIEFKSHMEFSTVLIEFPAESRLRLGAIPMVAHQVARMRERELELIADHLAKEESNPRYAWLFRNDHDHHAGTDDGWEQHRHSLNEMGKQLAADLLAVAAVGPQYLYAISRFAVGTLGDFGVAASRHNRLSLSARLSACLGYLNAHDDFPKFESPYFIDGPKMVPPAIVKIVRGVAVRCELPSATETEEIAVILRDGRIVDDASPTGILAALWEGVVQQSGYIHEVAALISIAADAR